MLEALATAGRVLAALAMVLTGALALTACGDDEGPAPRTPAPAEQPQSVQPALQLAVGMIEVLGELEAGVGKLEGDVRASGAPAPLAELERGRRELAAAGDEVRSKLDGDATGRQPLLSASESLERGAARLVAIAADPSGAEHGDALRASRLLGAGAIDLRDALGELEEAASGEPATVRDIRSASEERSAVRTRLVRGLERLERAILDRQEAGADLREDDLRRGGSGSDCGRIGGLTLVVTQGDVACEVIRRIATDYDRDGPRVQSVDGWTCEGKNVMVRPDVYSCSKDDHEFVARERE